jgi:hypothetical protein
MQFVLIEGEVAGSGGENFRQFAAHGATKQIHLPQTIGCGRVTLSEVEILVVFGFDVRNAAFIAVDGDLVLDAFDLD